MTIIILGMINVFIAGIILILEYERKRKLQIKNKNITQEIVAYNIHTGAPIYKNVTSSSSNQPVKNIVSEEDKTKISNSILIITGALLVVFASIIFLVSAWGSIPNIVKTLILVFIQLLFLTFENICNKKLNIPKISKVFSYLTYSFVPIILMSLSFFELVGDFFSISGEGTRYFFSLVFLITDITYKIIGKSKEDILLKQGSLIAELIAIIFFFSNFESPYILLFALVIHNIIMYILLQGNYLDNKAYKTLNMILSYILIPIAFLYSRSYSEIKDSIILFLLAGSFFYRIYSEKSNKNQPYLIAFLITYFIAVNSILDIDIFPYLIYIIALFPILSLNLILKEPNDKATIIKLVSIFGLIIIGLSILNAEKSLAFLSTISIGLILYLILYIVNDKKYYKFITYILFTTMLFSICYITEADEIAKYVLLVVPVLIYCIEKLMNSQKDKFSKIFIAGTLCIETIVLIETLQVIIPLILIFYYVKTEELNAEILFIPMLYSLSIFYIDNELACTIIGIILSIIYTYFSIKEEKFNIYLMFSFISLVLTCLSGEFSGITTFGLFFIWSIIHYFYSKEKEFFKLSSVLSLLGVYICLLNNLSVNMWTSYSIGIYISLMLITRFVFKIKNKNVYILESIIVCLITFVSSFIISDVVDGLFLIFTLLILAILSYRKNYNNYLYGYIISMIGCIIILSSEYLKDIPWYVYILLIGLALIIFALFDEKKKQSKKTIHLSDETKNNSQTQ